MAAVDTSSRFIWVNQAFEILTGYSGAELRERTWMDITKASDIGSDLRAVHELLSGSRFDYRMEKNYIHKRGHYVPIILTVRRFPVNHSIPLECFRVEASRQEMIKQQIDAHLEAVDKRIETNTRRLEEMERDKQRGVTMNVQSDQWSGGDKTGRDKITNDLKTFKILAGAMAIMFVAMILGGAYLFFYVASALNQNGNIPAPKIEIVK